MTRESEHVRRTVRVVRYGARGLYRSHLPRMAAALAYRTIFSIIPVFVISLLVVGSILSDQDVESGIHSLLEYTGLDQISIQDGADGAGDGGDGGAEVEGPVAGGTPSPVTGPDQPTTLEELDRVGRIDQLIRDLIDRVRGRLADVSRTSIAVVSALILIYAALSMLVELEKSFNQICGAPAGRPWMRRLVLYWAILTLGGLVIAATFSIGNEFLDWANTLVGGTKAVAAVLGFVVTVAISTLLLASAYLAVPNKRLRVRPVLAGALVAAVLWELLKWGFRSYLDFSTGYAKFYGNLALLPLFLLWVYATWLTVLFGLQVAYTMQTFGEWDENEGRPNGPTIVDPACILLVAASVARRFAQGKPSQADHVADDAGIPADLAARMLKRLAELGVVHEVERGEDLAFSLARPAEAIDASEVLRAATALTARRDAESDPAYAELAAARERALAGRTLADFARPKDPPAPS